MHRPNENQLSQVFTEAQEEHFLQSGFVKLEEAFPKAVAEEACAILWLEWNRQFAWGCVNGNGLKSDHPVSGRVFALRR